MPDSDYYWGYDPEFDVAECICGLPVKHWAAYCGPSCELADELGIVDPRYAESIVYIPFVLYRRYE